MPVGLLPLPECFQKIEMLPLVFVLVERQQRVDRFELLHQLRAQLRRHVVVEQSSLNVFSIFHTVDEELLQMRSKRLPRPKRMVRRKLVFLDPESTDDILQ